MKKFALLVSVFASLFTLSACSVSTPEAEIQEKAEQRLTIVSSGKPQEVLPAFTSFTWNDEYSRVLSAVNDSNEKEVKAHIRSEIIRYLKTKGYVYQPDPIQADVVIGFLFALENDVADQAIEDKFGLLPGLSNKPFENTRYEKGTLLLAVLDTDLRQVYWRSAMQGFVDLEKDKNDKSAQRMQKVLHYMMGDFPPAGR
ncbi:DUF4136 domain-containing protein [Psychromonas aquimarina]|uniref:DUF4136 domain-containing protein n=1 Tax=Psychromonas aquimarina TaxID=444919 RepID=UPI0004066343|nr:DUF4136 domain-containing protein [Psychromonas aquimarina]